MNPWFERLRSRTTAFAHDLFMLPIAWLLAYWLRFNLGEIPAPYFQTALLALPLVISVQGAVNWWFGLYRGVWRFASLPDLIRILKAVAVGTAAILFLLFLFNRMAFVPRSVPVLYGILQLFLLAGPRLLYRWLKDHRLMLREGKRVLIVGAGRAGEMLVRDLLRDPEAPYLPVAFVDDKLRHHGGEVQGVPIRGTTDQLPALAEALQIDLILLAIPSATAKQMQRLVSLCEQSGRPFRTVPQLSDLINDQRSFRQIRPVRIEDLLGREPVRLDWEGIRQGIAGKRVLITGGGGSIGSELCRQLARAGTDSLIIADHSEFNLYKIDRELNGGAAPKVLSRLVDVVDAQALDQLFAHTRPEIVFHAAAYKHVPLLEHQVRAAVRNNVLGTQRVAEAADRWQCERFVLISTDKAVHPANVMGATKRIAERLCQDYDRRSRTSYTAVRFGNVLGSAGSVVPLFRQQIERGGPVTVTHPEIQRFFMTIPEACQLIMQAAVLGQGGEIFVLDMGEPIKIRYLAEQMIRLSGKRPGEDIPIEYIGLRPGEKLYEELFYRTEALIPTDHPQIRMAQAQEAPDPGFARALNCLLAALDGEEARLRDRLAECLSSIAQTEEAHV